MSRRLLITKNSPEHVALHPLHVVAAVTDNFAELCGCSGVADWRHEVSAFAKATVDRPTPGCCHCGLCEVQASRVTAMFELQMAQICLCANVRASLTSLQRFAWPLCLWGSVTPTAFGFVGVRKGAN